MAETLFSIESKFYLVTLFNEWAFIQSFLNYQIDLVNSIPIKFYPFNQNPLFINPWDSHYNYPLEESTQKVINDF